MITHQGYAALMLGAPISARGTSRPWPPSAHPHPHRHAVLTATVRSGDRRPVLVTPDRQPQMRGLLALGPSTGQSRDADFIWSVADLLRGDYRQSEYGKVILPFTVLHRLDCVLEFTKEAVLALALVAGSGHRLSNMER